ncbi:MAG: GyrI-like domain-containing protein [Trueperaceae bacterium]|nr:GyrI-like domain-containing protein [Trueperaceae bacterium]
MAKLDLKRELKHLYAPSAKQISVVDVPTLSYLTVDGRGDPNTTAAYAEAVEALFSLSYAIKFAVKKSRGQDYAVMPLEGLWWSDDLSVFTSGDRSQGRSLWQWRMMILQPDLVTEELFRAVSQDLADRKQLPALKLVELTAFSEGSSAQVLHVGPFSEEGPTIERLHQHILDLGYELSGKHHEIYLSDIRKADPARWRTVIRQPFA